MTAETWCLGRVRLHLHLTGMALDHAEDHREAESETVLAFGREERLENPGANFGRHPNPGIPNLRLNPVSAPSHREIDRAPVGKRVDRVEHQVRESLTKVRRGSLNRRVAVRLDVDFDPAAVLLRRIAPGRSRQLRDFAHQGGQIELGGRLALGGTRVGLQTLHRLCAVSSSP